MAKQGWHLVEGGIRFVFQPGEPRQVRYRLDYRSQYPQGKSEYFALFQDAGWEHVRDYFSWHYFRSPVSTAAPEIFTDAESRAAKYRGLLVLVALVLAANLGILPGLLDRGFMARMSVFAKFLMGLQLCVLAFLAYAAIRLVLHIHRIKERREASALAPR